MTARNIPTFLALACLTTLPLTACGPGSPKAGRPNTAPPSSAPTALDTSSTPTAIPTSPPTRPAAANGLSLAAADAFYRYYIELRNYAARTGDTAPLTAESEAGCEGCKEYVEYVKKVNFANGKMTGDFDEKVKDIYQLARGSTGRVGGKALLTVGRYTVTEPPSEKPATIQPADYIDSIALSADDGNWVMYETDLAEQ